MAPRCLSLSLPPSCFVLHHKTLRCLVWPFSRERLRTHSIESSGKLKISPEQHCDFTAEDLRDLGEIGRGAYGSVNKMVHKPTGQIMAVKVTRYINTHSPSSCFKLSSVFSGSEKWKYFVLAFEDRLFFFQAGSEVCTLPQGLGLLWHRRRGVNLFKIIPISHSVVARTPNVD